LSIWLLRVVVAERKHQITLAVVVVRVVIEPELGFL
jgi:hypothetical protein